MRAYLRPFVLRDEAILHAVPWQGNKVAINVIVKRMLALLIVDLEHFPQLEEGLKLLFRLQRLLAAHTVLKLLVDGSSKDQTLLGGVSFNDLEVEEPELRAVGYDLVKDDLAL